MKNNIQLHSSFQKISTNSLFPGISVFLLLFIINAGFDPKFFTINTLYGNLSVITPIVLATIAQSIVILAGGLDLCLGVTMTLVNVIIATTLSDNPASVPYAMLLSLSAAIVVGIINGILAGYLKLPPMVATFGMSIFVSGVVLLILPTPGGYVPRYLFKLYEIRLGGFLPITIFIILITALIWWLVSKTSLVRYIYSVGGNEAASAASGIPTNRIKLYSYILSAVFIWLAGFVMTIQTATGDSRLGTSYTLTTIAAAIMGGIALAGGSGRMLGAGLGACVLIEVSNIIFYTGIPSFYQELIKGLIIIVALCITAIPKMKKRTI